MLYDNAQLARVYLHAWQITRDDFYRRIAEQTLDYVAREMTDLQGGFYSSQDADSEGVEGKCFQQTPDEIREALCPDWRADLLKGRPKGRMLSFESVLGFAGHHRADI